jgi:hypothetical protein
MGTIDMKLTLEQTEQFFMAGDVMCRAWTGTDAGGNACVALISLVQFIGDGQLDPAGLVSIPAPTRESAEQWAHTVLSGNVDFPK